MVKSILTYLNHLRHYCTCMVKNSKIDTVFLVTFVVNATWLDIILLNITPLKKL